MIRISVIMPVYNVEKYLRDSLDSLLYQTMIDDIEVIMIDDGSTDNSRYIIDEYAQNYDNFHAYHKKNEGQGIARNFGLDIACGEYVHFMDADDYLPPKAYENLYYFNPYNDFVVGNVLKFGEYNIWENILFKKAFKRFNGDVKSFRLVDVPNVLWDTITCNKLYKKAFLDRYNIRFINKDIYYEDLLFSLQTYILAGSIGFSRNIFYFWRLRKDKSSITQKQDDVRNFENRIEVLKIYYAIMNKYELSDELKNVVYSKWLNHDLKTSLKKIGNYPGKYYANLIKGTNDLLNVIPYELKEDLNPYLKMLYKMVENKDINSLLSFAHLEKDLKENPQMPIPVSDEYLTNLSLNCEQEDKEFEAHVADVFNDDKNLYLEFRQNLDFTPDSCPHETIITLITRNETIPLKARKNRLTLPLDLIKDKNHLKIKFVYKTKSFKKESLLKNYNRKSIRYADFDIDLGIGINNILYLDVRRKTDNQIVVRDVAFEDEELIFQCESIIPVENITLTNYVTYRQFNYPTRYSKNSNRFIFVIPYEDLTNNVINKWELNCIDSFNSIKLANGLKFIYDNSEIVLKNKRNKIFISNKFFIDSDDLDEIKMKNEELVRENNKLSNENIKLNKNVDELKSRKLVKMVDNVKNAFK